MSTGQFYNTLGIELVIDGDATAGLGYTTTRSFRAGDVVVVPTAVAAGATVALFNSAVPFTGPMPCAAIGTVARATNFGGAGVFFSPGDRLIVVAVGGGAPGDARCICTVYGGDGPAAVKTLVPGT